MIFYKNSHLATTKRILLNVFLFTMIIRAANGTNIGTNVAWDFETYSLINATFGSGKAH